MFAPVISTVLVGAFLLIPGAIPGLALTRRTELDAPGWIVISALISSSIYAVVYVAAMLVPVTLVQGIWLAAGLAVVVNGLAAYRGLRGPMPPWSPLGLYVLGGAMLASWIEGTWLVAPADSFYHLAAARSLIERGSLLVTDPLYGTVTDAVDPTSGLFQAAFAMWSVVRGADVLFLWAGMAALATVIVAGAFWTLARTVTGSDRAAMWGTIAFLVAGLFSDLRAAPYPSTIALAFVILAAALLAVVWDRRSLAAAGMVAAAALVVGMTHLGTAELLLIVAFVVSVAAGLSTAFFRGMRTEDRPWVSVAAVWATSAVVPAIVGAAAISRLRVIAESSLVTIGEGASGEALEGVISIADNLAIVEPGVFVERGIVLLAVATLLGIAMAVWGIRNHSRVVVAGSFVTLLPALLMLNPPVTGWLAEHSYYMLLRLAAMLHFTPFVGLAWLVWRAFFGGQEETGEARIAWSKVAAVAAAAVLLAGAFPYIQTVMTPWPTRALRIRAANESIAKSHATSALEVVSQPALGEFREMIGDDYPRVAAEIDISYTLAGILPISVVASPDGHSPMSIELVDGPMRRAAMDELLQPNTPGWRRAEIVEEYEADYVFVWLEDSEDSVVARSFLRQEEYFEPVIELYNVRVFKVKD